MIFFNKKNEKNKNKKVNHRTFRLCYIMSSICYLIISFFCSNPIIYLKNKFGLKYT